MNIREARTEDWPAIWPIFHEVVNAGDTYAYDPHTSKEQGEKIWLQTPRQTRVVESGGKILATYYLKTNQAGPGGHVCNCGYMVASSARGQGLAARMCEHSLQQARALGYPAMQFNFVASSNSAAVHLWSKLGFATVGRLPGAFRHPSLGYVDALVMYQVL